MLSKIQYGVLFLIDFINYKKETSTIVLLCDREAHTEGLHGPSMFAVKAKIYGVLYKQSSSIAFDETSSYWLAPKNS